MSAEPSVDPTQVVREEWDAIADVYDVSYRWPVDIAEDALIAKWLRRITDHDGRILDLGCGTGALLDLCPVKPGRYVGVDLSPRMVELAQEKHPRHKFVVSPMEDFAAGLSGFASIVSLYGSLSYVHPAAWPRVCQRNSELGTRVHLMPLAQGGGSAPSTRCPFRSRSTTPTSTPSRVCSPPAPSAGSATPP